MNRATAIFQTKIATPTAYLNSLAGFVESSCLRVILMKMKEIQPFLCYGKSSSSLFLSPNLRLYGV